MERDPNVQAILASFSALSSNQARRAAYETPHLQLASNLLISRPQILWHPGSTRP